MSAVLLDGSALSKKIKAALKAEAEALVREHGLEPTLAVLQIGDDPAAAGYARAIERNCRSVGVIYRPVVLDSDTNQYAAKDAVTALNQDGSVHGIMILEPLPEQLDSAALMDSLDPAKDVDGVTAVNAGRLAGQRSPYFAPATPAGAIRLLEEANITFQGLNAVVVGRSDIVGKPMALLLLHRHCTVTIAHSRTVDLAGLCRRADLLCVAVGRSQMVPGDWVRPGAIVVDFGTNYTDDGLKGDTEQASVAEVASMMTPVPGGTGPMTNAMLMQNVLQAARQLSGLASGRD